MKRFFLTLLYSTLIFTILTSCSSESTTQPEESLALVDKFQKAVDEGIIENGGKGFGVSVIIPGEEPWFGVGGFSYGITPVTKDMLFAAGSTTKNFTAVLILQLAEEGKLTLDDSLHKWLPVYPNIDSTITVRQLLNHTCGIYNFTDHPDVWGIMFSNSYRIFSHEEIIRDFVLAPVFEPGSGWSYSNTGYLLLAMIIEKATASSISVQFRNRFWARLNMNNTFLAAEETLPDPFAHGWFDLNNDNQYEDLSSYSLNSFYSAASTAGAVFSTAEDLAKWAKALYSDKLLLSQSSLNKMMNFYSPIPGEPLLDGYGLGIIRYSREIFNGVNIIGHSGDAPGYTAASLYLPDYGVCLGVTDNTDRGDNMVIVNELLNIITEHLNK